jgi:hypothetical protein
MASNQFNIKRTAFANFTVPTSLTATGSTQTGAYIPAGAIVTGIRVMAGDAVTIAGASNATITPYVGAVALATNNIVASAVIAQTDPYVIGLAATKGVYIPTGGYLDIDFGSTGTDASSLVADADIYVDYIYCDSRDDS